MNKRLKSLALMTSLALCQPAYGNPWDYVAAPWEFVKENTLPLGAAAIVGTIGAFVLVDVVTQTSVEESNPPMANYVYHQKWSAFFASPEEIRDYLSYYTYLEGKEELTKNSLVPRDHPVWKDSEEIFQDLIKLEPDGSSLSLKDLPTLVEKYDERNKKNSEGEVSSPPHSLTHLRQFMTRIVPLHLGNVPISLDQTSILALLLASHYLRATLEKGSLYKIYHEAKWRAAKYKILFSLKGGLYLTSGMALLIGLKKVLSLLLV
jgi:hypothetical protein